MFTLGHSAAPGCSKYDNYFLEMRTTEQLGNQMHEIMSCNMTQDQYKLESSYGTRFSVLAFLLHFDTIRMIIIDPMHNLFFGSVKNLKKQIVSSYLTMLEKYHGKLLVGLMASMLTNIKTFCYFFSSIHYMGSFHQEILTAYENFFLPVHVYAKKLFQKVSLL